jgi:hypothetical protein
MKNKCTTSIPRQSGRRGDQHEATPCPLGGYDEYQDDQNDDQQQCDRAGDRLAGAEGPLIHFIRLGTINLVSVLQ